MRIAVTTPTGRVGSRVVRLLLQAGERPVVLVRDPARLDPAVRALVDVAQGDLGDADFVRAATAGADALYWVDPTDFAAADPNACTARLGANAAAAVTANGILRTVFQSSVGAEKRGGAGLIDGLAAVEQLLDATGQSVTHLRCGYFFSNVADSVEQLRTGVLTTAADPVPRMPWVDPRDVGDVAAARLLSTSWSGRHVQAVHGPADLAWSEVPEILSTATGRRMDLVRVSDEQAAAVLRSSGMGAATVDGIVGMTAGLREGFVPEQRRTVVTTTPTTLAGWAHAELRPLLEKP